MTITWVNGYLFDESHVHADSSPSSEPSTSDAWPGPLDPGLLIGDGVFTTLALYDNVPFALSRHIARLFDSCEALGFGSVSPAQIHGAIAAVLDRARLLKVASVARMRITIWRPAGSQFGTKAQHAQSMSVALLDAEAADIGTINSTPIKVLTSDYVRNMRSAISGHKSTSYAENAYALRAAQLLGYGEAAFFNTDDDLSEGSMSNIVVELGGELVTPSLSSGCLPGITRQLALEWGGKAGLPMREAEPGELTRAIVGNPAALLGTLRNVQTISHWDNTALKPGTLLPQLQQVFAEASARSHRAEIQLN